MRSKTLAIVFSCFIFLPLALVESQARVDDPSPSLLKNLLKNIKVQLFGSSSTQESQPGYTTSMTPVSLLPELYVPSADVQRWVKSIIAKGEKRGEKKGATGYFSSHYFVPHRLSVKEVSLFNLTEDRRPLNKVQFLKTHKTGSSSVQGILFRQAFYGSAPMAPYAGGHHILNYETESNFISRHYGLLFKHYEIMPGKTIDDLKRYLEMITPNGLLTTIVRDPVSRAISSHLYYDVPSKKTQVDIEESLRQMAVGDNTAQLMHLNLTATIPQLLNDIDKVDMLLLDRFDESLVLRHFLWGWPLEEMIYIKANSCGGLRWDGKIIPCPPASFKEQLPKDLAEKIIRQSPIDSLVYQRAVDRHETLVSMIDSTTWKSALKEFRRMLASLEILCSPFSTGRSLQSFGSSRWRPKQGYARYGQNRADRQGLAAINIGFAPNPDNSFGSYIPRVPPPGLKALSFPNVENDPVKFCPLFRLSDIQVETLTRKFAAHNRLLRK